MLIKQPQLGTFEKGEEAQVSRQLGGLVRILLDHSTFFFTRMHSGSIF